MAETKQAKKSSSSILKRQRQSLKAYQRNRVNLSELKTALKKFNAISNPDDKAVSSIHSKIDKAFRRRVISKNASARRKSIASLSAATKRQVVASAES